MRAGFLFYEMRVVHTLTCDKELMSVKHLVSANYLLLLEGKRAADFKPYPHALGTSHCEMSPLLVSRLHFGSLCSSLFQSLL